MSLHSCQKEEENPFNKILFFLISLVFLGYIYRGEIGINFEFALGLIFFIGMYHAWKQRFKRIDYRIFLWIGILLFYWLAAASSALYYSPLADRGNNLFTINHLAILFTGLLLATYYLKPTIDFFWWLIGVAAIAMLGLMSLEVFALGFEAIKDGQRIGGVYSQIIKMGVFANIFFIILLGSIPWAHKKGYVFLAFWLSMIFLLLVGVILTQARTAWLGWPEAIIGWSLYYFFFLKNKRGISPTFKVTIIIFPLIVLMGLLSLKPINSLFEKRFSAIYHNIDDYYSGNDFQTSIGLRLLGYEVAVDGIKNHLWFGIGEDAFPEFQKQQTASLALEKFNTKIDGYTYNHIHNQFLMSWLTKGVFAFVSVACIFVFLIWHFITGLRNASFDNKPIWIAGLVFSIASLLSFLPETPLQKSDTSTHFFLLATLLIVFSILTEQRQNKINLEDKVNEPL